MDDCFFFSVQNLIVFKHSLIALYLGCERRGNCDLLLCHVYVSLFLGYLLQNSLYNANSTHGHATEMENMKFPLDKNQGTCVMEAAQSFKAVIKKMVLARAV